MNLTKIHVAIVVALTAAACSSDPSAENEYPQPAASVGDEATPTEVAPSAVGQEASAARPATPAAASSATMTPTATLPETVSPAPGAVQLTDAEIAKVVDVVNTGEIEQGQFAKTKASDARVKNFAVQMVDQHTQMKQGDTMLARKLTITPEDNAVAQQLSNEAAKTLADLKLVEATRFDQTYMQAQVKQHQAVLDHLDNQLIPQAKNSEMKAALQKARTMVQKHLADAQQIQAQLPAH